MGRKPRNDFPELLIERVSQVLVSGQTPVISEVCKELGISPALVNYHFANRAELMSRAWERIVLSSIDSDFDRLDAMGQTADWDAVAEFIFEVFSNSRSLVRMAHLRAISEGLTDDHLRSVIDRAQERTHELWRTLLERYTSTGVLHPRVSLDALALLFMAAPLGVTAAKQNLNEREQRELADAWMAMLAQVLR